MMWTRCGNEFDGALMSLQWVEGKREQSNTIQIVEGGNLHRCSWRVSKLTISITYWFAISDQITSTSMLCKVGHLGDMPLVHQVFEKILK